MDFKKLTEEGLLEQYLLGLTSREESQSIEAFLDRSPQARAELDFLKKQLGLHLAEGEQNVDLSPAGSRLERTSLQKTNRRLRYLVAGLTVFCCLLLIAAVHYQNRSVVHYRAHLSERAQHIQDDQLYTREIESLSTSLAQWNHLHTQTVMSTHGPILVHHLQEQALALVDLSHLGPPDTQSVYLFYDQVPSSASLLSEISATDRTTLHPITITGKSLTIFHQSRGKSSPPEQIAALPSTPLTDLK